MTGRVTGYLFFALVFTVSAVMLAVTLSSGMWDKFSGSLAGYRTETLMGAAALLLVSVLFLQTALITRRSKDYLSITNDGGSINISTDAICAYIEKVTSGIPAVIKIKAKVVPVSGGMNVMIDLKMKAIPQMQDVCDTLQKMIRENLATGLGIKQVGKVEIIVRDIVEAG